MPKLQKKCIRQRMHSFFLRATIRLMSLTKWHYPFRVGFFRCKTFEEGSQSITETLSLPEGGYGRCRYLRKAPSDVGAVSENIELTEGVKTQTTLLSPRGTMWVPSSTDPESRLPQMMRLYKLFSVNNRSFFPSEPGSFCAKYGLFPESFRAIMAP